MSTSLDQIAAEQEAAYAEYDRQRAALITAGRFPPPAREEWADLQEEADAGGWEK